MRPAHMRPGSRALPYLERLAVLVAVFAAVDLALSAVGPIVGEWWAAELDGWAMLAIGMLMGEGVL